MCQIYACRFCFDSILTFHVFQSTGRGSPKLHFADSFVSTFPVYFCHYAALVGHLAQEKWKRHFFFFSAFPGASGRAKEVVEDSGLQKSVKIFNSICRTRAYLVPPAIGTHTMSPVYAGEVKTSGLWPRELSSILIFR